jgi:hypothetical protein
VTRTTWKDSLLGWLIVTAVFAVPLSPIVYLKLTEDPAIARPQPQAAAPAPTIPPAPAPQPVPPLDSPEACAFGAPPQPGLMAECERRRLEERNRRLLAETEKYRGLRPGGGGPSLSPRGPSSPRPIQPYPALPGDPNDRDHVGRACESGCIN